MYQDMKKYSADKFTFEILAEAEVVSLKEAEQQFIEKMHPTYNNRRAKGWDIEIQNKYNNQLCLYNGETLTLNALSMRFRRRGISNPTTEAKKYLLNK